jgi:hypothetical protein
MLHVAPRLAVHEVLGQVRQSGASARRPPAHRPARDRLQWPPAETEQTCQMAAARRCRRCAALHAKSHGAWGRVTIWPPTPRNPKPSGASCGRAGPRGARSIQHRSIQRPLPFSFSADSRRFSRGMRTRLAGKRRGISMLRLLSYLGNHRFSRSHDHSRLRCPHLSATHSTRNERSLPARRRHAGSTECRCCYNVKRIDCQGGFCTGGRGCHAGRERPSARRIGELFECLEMPRGPAMGADVVDLA